MSKLKLFIPLTKVDVENRLVYGRLVSAAKDHASEIFDYATSKPLFQKWSDDISKATSGQNLGNVRAMHGHVAAGKLTAINFEDEAETIEGCAKVVDDNEWNKVLEGVYTGFSIGGSYAKRWKDGNFTRYTASPVEVSLVDLPCIPDCQFSVVKADGSSEMRKFKSVVEVPAPSATDVAAEAQLLATAAKDADWTKFLVPATESLNKRRAEVAVAEAATKALTSEEPVTEPTVEEIAAAAELAKQTGKPVVSEDSYEQVWLSKADGKTFAKKADMLAHVATLVVAPVVDPLVAKAQEILNAIKPPVDKAVATAALEGHVKNYTDKPTNVLKRVILKSARTDKLPLPADFIAKDVIPAGLNKSLYFVSSMVRMLAELECMEDSYESYGEFTDKAVADRFGSLVVELGDVVAEMLDRCLASTKQEEAIEAMAMAATIDTLIKAVRGKDKEHVQKAHDAVAALGASCGTSKTVTEGELAKMTGERDNLAKTVAAMTPLLDQILKSVKNIEEQPAGVTVPSTLRIVGKNEDGGGIEASGDATLLSKLVAMSPEQQTSFLSTLAIKAAQQQPNAMKVNQ